MAAGDDFTLTPNLVVTRTPAYYNVITQSESGKKEYMNIASTPTEQYELQFNALTNSQRDTLLTHYKDNYGGYHSFIWKSVPSYINSGADMTGRWVDGSLRMSPVGNLYWRCSVVFEKEI